MNEIQRYLSNFIEEIKLLVDKKTKTLKFDKTIEGKVVSINNEICEVEINGEIFECKIRNDLQIDVGDIVLIKIINNDFSNKYIDAKLGTVGDGISEGIDWANVLNKPTEFNPSPHNHDVSSIAGLSTVATSGDYNDLLNKPTTYIHIQSVPLEEWIITHNLNKFPNVTVVDSGGSVVIGDIQYIDSNQIKITFMGSFGGKAFLN